MLTEPSAPTLDVTSTDRVAPAGTEVTACPEGSPPVGQTASEVAVLTQSAVRFSTTAVTPAAGTPSTPSTGTSTRPAGPSSAAPAVAVSSSRAGVTGSYPPAPADGGAVGTTTGAGGVSSTCSTTGRATAVDDDEVRVSVYRPARAGVPLASLPFQLAVIAPPAAAEPLIRATRPPPQGAVTSSRQVCAASACAVTDTAVPSGALAGGPAGFSSAAWIRLFTWARIAGRYG